MKVCIITLILALCALDVQGQDCDAVKGPLQELNAGTPTDLRIVHTGRFLCGGLIESYDLYAMNTGTIYFGVWRPQELGGIIIRTWTLVDFQKVEVTKTGKQTITIPRSDRMEVQAHDCIGFHYDPGTANGIIPFENSNISPRKYTGALLRVYKDNYNSGNLRIGQKVTGQLIRKPLIPALNAHLEPKPQCVKNNGGCDQVCDDSSGIAICSCNPGYTLVEETKCEDIDECASASTKCDHGCQNTPGSYTCSCKAGFELADDGFTCEKLAVNECNTNNGGCDHTCTDKAEGYSCGCNSGFTLGADKHKCVDIDECASASTKCDHGCQNTPGSYTCSCRGGFELADDGFTCEKVAVNECNTNNGGCDHTCTDKAEGYSCGCNSGFTLGADKHKCIADKVEVVSCSTNNGGCEQVCIQEGDKFECDCKEGFLLKADKTTCEEYDPIPEALFMLQAYNANRDRVCYSVDYGSATHLRLVHDPEHDITINGRIKKSSDPEYSYFTDISFKREKTYMEFSYEKVVIDGKDYTWDNVPAKLGKYEIAMKRPGETITVKFRVPRRQVVFLFDRSVEFATQTKRVDVTIFRNQGLSNKVVGVIGEHYKARFGPVGTPDKTYGTEAKFYFGDTAKDSTSLRHRNSRNSRNMPCWEINDDIPVSADDKISGLRA